MRDPLNRSQPQLHNIAVLSLSQARRRKRDFDAVLTLEDPDARSAIQLRFHNSPSPDHLIIRFEDVDDDTSGVRVATRDQVEQSLAFGRTHQTSRLLIHCFQGVGRSPGIALAIIADRLGQGNERLALKQLLEVRPQAIPNLVVVKLADDLLGRDGQLVLAVDDWERTATGIKESREARMQFVRSNPHLYSWI